MNIISIMILLFSILGALDRILGNRFGLGREFERGFNLFGAMALSMIGMIIIAPALGVWLRPLFESFYQIFRIDPSVIPALLFANDMGGASLSIELAGNAEIGRYNAFVVSSMMGCVISFTIPFASGVVDQAKHKDMFLGFLCGIVTIPIGSFVAGLVCGLAVIDIMINLLPLIVISVIIAIGILTVPEVCVRIFSYFGLLIKTIITIGLAIGIYTFITGNKIIDEFSTLEEGAEICVNACVTLTGAFPLMYVVGRMLNKPMAALGSKLGINATSALGFVPTLVTNTTTFGMMQEMDPKGVVLNSAFAVSASFVFGSHLGFTMGLNKAYIAPMIIAKITAGIAAIALALLIYKKNK